MDTNNVMLKTDQATIWIDDVTAEMDAVKEVLAKTKNCLEHDPDDDIWFEFERIVNNLSLYWEGLTKASKTACETIKSVIAETQKTGEEIVEYIKGTMSKLTN